MELYKSDSLIKAIVIAQNRNHLQTVLIALESLEAVTNIISFFPNYKQIRADIFYIRFIIFLIFSNFFSNIVTRDHNSPIALFYQTVYCYNKHDKSNLRPIQLLQGVGSYVRNLCLITKKIDKKFKNFFFFIFQL